MRQEGACRKAWLGLAGPAAGELVDEMASRILYFSKDSSGPRKKVWMFMRWMVRPAPDLRLFDGFLPRNLQIPLDRNTCR